MSKYLVRANIEGVSDFAIEETFSTRFFALRAVKYALKKGLLVRIMKV